MVKALFSANTFLNVCLLLCNNSKGLEDWKSQYGIDEVNINISTVPNVVLDIPLFRTYQELPIQILIY